MRICQRPPVPAVGVFLIVLLAGMIGIYSASARANQIPAGAVPVGDATCLDCHDDLAADYAVTVHGSLGAKAGIQCESCHGPGSAHVEETDPAMIINPAKQSQFDDSPTCLGCHNNDTFDDWEFSHHNSADVNCSACHQVHAQSETWTSDYVREMCFECHNNVRASMFMPSRHPIREDKVSCLDCHNVHGGSVALMQENTGRELCFSCHPEKEGPFVYEHAPANEDCMLCHTPHGSVADNLLIANEPTLCLNCHAMHFHATIEGWDGDFGTPQAPERAGTSTPDGWKRGMLTKCTQCHTAVHGTDLPSQAVSTSGTALTR